MISSGCRFGSKSVSSISSSVNVIVYTTWISRSPLFRKIISITTTQPSGKPNCVSIKSSKLFSNVSSAKESVSSVSSTKTVKSASINTAQLSSPPHSPHVSKYSQE